MFPGFTHNSLGARVLRQMAVRIALVICIVTLASYWHVYRAVTTTASGTLAEYVRQRGERESQLFLLAEDNLRILMRTFLAERGAPGMGVRSDAFDRTFERNADGAWRRRNGFDIHQEPSAYIARRVELDAAARREMMTILELVRDFGRAWNNLYVSAFLASLDGMAATYLPGTDWYRDLPPDEDFTRYPWVRNVLPANNPERKPQWTGIWLDWANDIFAATCILPADIDGEFRYYAGTSVRLDAILKRTRETGLAGTYNMIFRADGRLISHPDEFLMAELRANKGDFLIPAAGDAHLQAIYRTALQAPAGGVLALDSHDEYLGVARIAGPEWYFVTVMPKQLLSETARSTAQMVLWLGLAALLLELAIVGWIIRRQIARPLARVVERVAAFGAGDSSTRIATVGTAELDQLGARFNEMAGRIEAQRRELVEHAASLEEKVAERTRQLEEKERAKTRFLAAASHDLRQPIQAAALFLDNLKHSRLDEAQRATVDYLELSVKSLRELLDALLDISRLDAGAVQPCRAAFDLAELLARLAAEFAPQAQAKGLQLRLRPLRGPSWVYSDRHLTATILRNLIANAVAYTARGGILVGVRRRDGQIRLSVWDTGSGIAAEHRERIYEEFYQIENPQRDRGKGLGLGLAIARRAADLLGSRLACASRPGRGTRFELDLPSAAAMLAPAANHVPLESFAGRRFVVVENDRYAAESLRQWLATHGGTVVLHADAETALGDAAEADGYIVDYRLGGTLDGIACLDALRQRHGGRLAGILVTGDTSPDFIERAEGSGWPILYKPIEPDALRAALGAAMAANAQARP